MSRSDRAQRTAVIEALAETLDQIDAGELVATSVQRAYIAGARDVLAGLPDVSTDEPPTY